MVATALHELAGAFVPESPVDEIVLVSGDSDFWPVLRRLLKHRPTLRVCVCATARQGSVQTAYLKWMGDESRARFVELRETLKLLGGDAKLNFENLARVPDAERPGCVRRLPHCLALCIALLCSICVVRALVACPHCLSLCICSTLHHAWSELWSLAPTVFPCAVF
jgi:hypothetical protein